MTAPTDIPPPLDSGLASFALLLRLLGVAATPEQIAHQLDLGGRAMGADDMLRAGKQLGLKARLVKTRPDRLAKTPLPAIALRPAGGCFGLANVADGKVRVQ